MRVYISGPMTGKENHNYPAFHEAEQRFMDWGWVVFNPAHNFGGRVNLPRPEYMRVDLALLLQVDAIALLPGWESSPGALLEVANARELGLWFFDAATGEPISAPTVVLEAH